MASTEMAVTVADEQEHFSNRQKALIKATIAPGIDDDQLGLFGIICQRTGLDPFSRQIYAVMRNQREKDDNGGWRTTKKMVIQTGIDGYRAIASRTGALAGIEDAIYDTEEADHPNKATVTVWRLAGGSRCPFTATARWGEYAQYKDEYKDGKPTGAKTVTDMWAKMPYLMLGKCAEALALRKAFPNEISGVYTAEEMAQADNDAPTSVTRANLDRFAKEHGIERKQVEAGLKKYAGDVARTLDAMRAYVEKRDATATTTAAEPEPEMTVTVQEYPLDELNVGRKGN